MHYNSPTVLLSALLLCQAFLAMKEYRPKFVKKIILAVSPLVFGVFLIHEHPFLRNFIWSAFNRVAGNQASVLWIPGAAIVIFGVCIIIEKVRVVLFRCFRINRFEELLESFLNKWKDIIMKKYEALN